MRTRANEVFADSAPLAAYTRGRRGAVARLDAIIRTQDAATSILNYGEVIEGLYSFLALAQVFPKMLWCSQVEKLIDETEYHVCHLYPHACSNAFANA